MKTIFRNALIILLLGLSTNIFAQEEEKEAQEIRPFQMTFVTPLGTNGVDSWNITNRFSLNIFAGVNGGVEGMEIGAFANILKKDMNGMQIAGFANHVGGKSKGLQVAGFYNFSHSGIEGLQVSGFLNGSTGYTKGLQVAGFLNYAHAGNASQIAGFLNVQLENVEGIQGAGFSNIVLGDLKGIQASGFYNQAKNVKGFQVAGFANVATEDVKGVQVSGFLNRASKVKGAQIGVFNIADTIEDGIAIGVLSFVKNGYQALEIGGNETEYGYLNFKTGTHTFYNILSVGGRIEDDRILWGWGYGVGTYLPLSQRTALNIEALGYHINEDEWFTNHLNEHYKAQAMFSYNVSDHLAIYGGPVWNVIVSKEKNHNGEKFQSTVAPYTVFDKLYKRDVRVSMYPGFNVGLRIY
jgi:hypothetical protein